MSEFPPRSPTPKPGRLRLFLFGVAVFLLLEALLYVSLPEVKGRDTLSVLVAADLALALAVAGVAAFSLRKK